MKNIMFLFVLFATYTYSDTIQIKHGELIFTITTSEKEGLQSYQILMNKFEVPGEAEGEHDLLSGVFQYTQGSIVIKSGTLGAKSGGFSGAIIAVEIDSVTKLCFIYSLNKEVNFHPLIMGMDAGIKKFDENEFIKKIKTSESINYIIFKEL